MSDIDHIPIDWQKLPLKRVADITNSGCYGADDASDERGEPLRAITTAHIDPLSGFKTDNASVRYFSRHEKTKYVGRRGDIFVVKSSGSNENVITGKRAQIRDEDDLVFTNFLLRVRANERSNPRFLYHLLGSSLVHSRIKREVATTTYPNLNMRQYLGEPLPLPDLATQRQIADFLDRETSRIDLLIEKKQRLVALLGEKARRDVSSIFEKLAHDNRIWRLKHVLVAGLAYGANEPSDGDDPDDVRYIRITDIDADGNLRDDTFKSLPRERIRDYILEDGDILFARSGATVGKSFIYREHMGECCYAGYLIRARVNTKLISPDFLKHFTSTDQYWNHILGTNIQATIQNVSAEKYANLAFPLPPLSVQREISARVMRNEERYAATKSSVNASIDRLKEYRSALITAAVTGQIDVSTYAKSGTPDRRLDAIHEEMGA